MKNPIYPDTSLWSLTRNGYITPNLSILEQGVPSQQPFNGGSGNLTVILTAEKTSYTAKDQVPCQCTLNQDLSGLLCSSDLTFMIPSCQQSTH